MQEPFPVLTRLYMRSYREDTSVLTTKFLGGSAPHLQAIALHRIPFPALPTLLSSTSELFALNLFDLPMPSYISPERMVACSATLPRLEVFSITFRDDALRPDQINPPPATRSVLPALTKFLFGGAFEYLENLVAQIDTPRLKRVTINYLDPPDNFQVVQLSDFINRSIGPELAPSRHAQVYFQFDRVTFTLSRDHETYQGWDRRSVKTIIHFWPQQPDVAEVLSQFSAALCTVVYLELDAELDESDHSGGVYDADWLLLLNQHPVVRTLYVYQELATPVSLALEEATSETISEALPSLGLICLEGEPASSLEKIVAIRRFSDHPITVVETTDEFGERLESYVSR